MLKFILKLLLLILVAMFCWQLLAIPALQNNIIKSLEKAAIKEKSAELRLLASELNRLKPPQRAAALAQIQMHYGFTLQLTDADQLSIGAEELENLHAGETLVTEGDFLSLHYLLDDAETLVSILNPDEAPSHMVTETERVAMGGFWMVEKQLLSLPQTQWPEALAALVEKYAYPYRVTILSLTEVTLADSEREKMLLGRIVNDSADGLIANTTINYKRVADSEWVIRVEEIGVERLIAPYMLLFYTLMALVVVAPLIIWLLPTAQSMIHLSRATQDFGRGDFSARAKSLRFSNISELSCTFNAMANKIQKLFNSHKLLTNAVSHDLRTPLSRLEFAIELLRSSETEVKREEQLERMEGAVEELNNLVAEMLLFAKFDREKPTFNLDKVNVSSWLNSEIEDWDLNKNNVVIDCICEDQLDVLLERYYMARVLGNLLRNAIQYSRSRVQVSFSVEAKHCYLLVEDDGFGIAVKDREQIFEPFMRLEESRNRDTGGTGLGLAIVRQVMLWLEGTISIEQSDLGGAKFILQWPIRMSQS